MVKGLQFNDGLAGEIDRQSSISGTPCRLTAAGLPFRDDDLASCRLKQTQARKTNGRAHQINEAGDV